MISKRLLINILGQHNRQYLRSFLYGHRSKSFSSKQGNDGDTTNVVSTKQSDNEIQENSNEWTPETLEKKSVSDLLQESEVRNTEEVEPEFPSDVQNDSSSHRDYDAWRQSQEKHAFRPKVDPRETSLFLFPGQGSQFVGMASKLLPYPNVKEIFQVANEILGYDLLQLCLNGPKSDLDSTVFCQPAIFVTSIAAIEKLRDDNPKAIEMCIGAAGFSIGEFAALVFAGSLSFEDALKLVKIRAEAMQAASNQVPSGMMSVFLRPDSRLKFACHAARMYCQEKLGMEEPVCTIANYLYPECKVIAGHEEALKFIQEYKGEFSLARIKRLPVSGAFHTSLMREASVPLQKAMSKIQFQRPLIPVYCNVTSHKYHNEKHFAKLLKEQVYKPVKWEQLMHVMYSRKQGEEFPFTYELGPGRQLGTLLKMTNSKAYSQYSPVDV